MAIVTRALLLPIAGVVTVLFVLVVALALAGCSVLEIGLVMSGPRSAENGEPSGEPGGDRFPDVLAVELRATGDLVFDVVVTLSSPYDTPQRYADGWRVMDTDGNVLGAHKLLHDHATEQPSTRTQPGLVIPAGTTEIIVEGRDQANGYGGLALAVAVPDG